MAQILIIEDNTTMREGIFQILSSEGHEVQSASGGKEGLALFHSFDPDFTITDLKMADMNGLEVLQAIREGSPESIVMLITAFGTIETAVDAMKKGAFDFITKPFPPELLRVKVAQALKVAKVQAENRFLRMESSRKYADGMVGASKALERVRQQITQVAPTDSTVLIAGESGTGKELVARSIHAQSERAEKPFIKVDCTALAEGVLESELFGHERGAFTGATNRKPGRFELADKGTIFLDEIGEISPSVQLKLLRVLQDRSFERVGGTRTLDVDVRIISATNKDLLDQISKGKFREDLYYRLHIVPIKLPPLRERREDIGLIAQSVLSRLEQKHRRAIALTPDAISSLESYSWPGNIRELQNLLEGTFVLNTSGQIESSDFPDPMKKPNHHVDLELPEEAVDLTEALEEMEKRLILRAYKKSGGVKTKTAQVLGIKTSALYYKLEKYGIYSKD